MLNKQYVLLFGIVNLIHKYLNLLKWVRLAAERGVMEGYLEVHRLGI